MSAKLAAVGQVVVTGRKALHKHPSDAGIIRVPKCGIWASNHDTWETTPLVDPAGDGNIPRTTFARDPMGELPKSVGDNVGTSWTGGDMDCSTNFGVGHKDVRAPNVAQTLVVVELVAGNPDVQGHIWKVQTSGCDSLESKEAQKSSRRLARSRPLSWPSSSLSASSSAVRFLPRGITLSTAALTFSSVSERRGTSCVGNGEAADAEERAEEGTSSEGCRYESARTSDLRRVAYFSLRS